MPRAVVFDVGKVLIDFSFAGFQKFLGEHGADFKDTKDFINKTNLYDFEKGLISSIEFYQNINKSLITPITNSELEKQWQNIFSPVQTMLSLIQEVRAHRPTFLLSNTNETHWKYLLGNYKLDQFVEGYLTSFDAKVMKPDDRIYLEFSKKFGFKSEEILFIDDLIANIKTAQTHGWRTIHHVSEQETREKISLLLPI